MLKKKWSGIVVAVLLCSATQLAAQNPLITDQYTADPTARVFGDRVYVYPSHDIPPAPGKGRANWFVMEDYHVFSSENLTEWNDHGVIVTQNEVPWVKPNSYSMWAPDCVYRNGKYYFYFPSTPADSTIARGFTVGVAVSDKPTGPFVPQPQPIKNVSGIDPNVMIDKDGQAYLYWSQGHIYGAKLKENMLELDSEPVILQDLPTKGLKEGPYVFERNGIYYMTYPHVDPKTERLEYATSNSPLGPFTFKGVIMDASESGCWTNHHSIVNFKNQWYLFYHDKDLSPNFDKNRSIRADSLSFNSDGTIRKVVPTLRGVGLSAAGKNIQVDRYSGAGEGVSVSFLDTAARMKGWKATLPGKGAWIRYNAVDFGKAKFSKAVVRALSAAGSSIELRADRLDGPLLGTVAVSAAGDWKLSTSAKAKIPAGVHDLFVVLKSPGETSVDWVKFE